MAGYEQPSDLGHGAVGGFALPRRRAPWALALVERGVVRIAMSLTEQVAAVRALFERYDNVPASLADACLVRMSELHEPCRVMTLDSDFLIYRRHGRKIIPVLALGKA